MAFAAGYRYRFDPTPEQADLLRRTFGCVRVVYNRALHERETAWRERGERLRYADLSKRLPAWKVEWPWLAEVSSVPVQQALRYLESAYSRFFQRLGRKPVFKSRRHRQSATFMKTAFRFRDGQLTLALMREPLAIRWSRALPSAPSSVTISLDAAGRWHVAFRIEVEPEPAPEPLRPAIGIDLGLMTLAVSSDGASVANPRWLRQRQHRLRRATLRKPGARWRACMLASPTRGVIITTSSRPNGSVRTKRSTSRRCPCAGSPARAWRAPSMMPRGARFSQCSGTRRRGTGATSSRSTASSRARVRARAVVSSVRSGLCTFGYGRATPAASRTTATRMQRTTFWPRGTRSGPGLIPGDCLWRGRQTRRASLGVQLL